MRAARALTVAVTTAGLLLGSMGVAKADTLYNTVDTTYDNDPENFNIKVGQTGEVALRLTAREVSQGGLNSDAACLISPSNPAWIELDAPNGNATVRAKYARDGHPSNRLIFEGCSDGTGQLVVVTGVAFGDSHISVTVNEGIGRASAAQVKTDFAKFKAVVAKGDQTITFAAPASPALDGSTFRVNPTASSGSAVNLAATGACSATGFDVTMTAGSGSCTLTASQAGSLNWNAATSITHTVAAAPAVNPNVAPTKPGKPAASTSPNAGTFTLGWTESTDADNDSITYTVERKSSEAGVSFQAVMSAPTSSSYAFANHPEGTWTYRVKASDGALSSDYSADSDPVKVDRAGPNAPTAAATTDPDYTDSNGNGWWKGSVTVGFTANGDPNLVDGTVGSGVADQTLSSDQTFSTTGSHTASGTVKDNVGNPSEAGTLDVRVDADKPTASVSTTAGCPSGNLVQGSTASFDWTASDTGSGLSTAASGTTTINTSAIGTGLTATGPKPVDNVGNVGTAPTCTYNVVYSSTGILQPINSDDSSSFKLGSTIPVKIKLTGASAGTSNATITIVNTKLTGTITGEDSEVSSTATPHSGNTLRYDAGSDQYVFNLSTKNLSTGTWRITLHLGDGTTRTASYSIVK